MSSSTVRDLTYRLTHFLIINNCLSVLDNSVDFISLKNKILLKFPWFITVDKQFLCEQRKQEFLNMKDNFCKGGLEYSDSVDSFSFFHELLCLSTYLNIFLQKIPIDCVKPYFSDFKVSNSMNNKVTDCFYIFTLSLEFVYYLFEIDFIPNFNSKRDLTEPINIHDLKKVVQVIGVLYFIQKADTIENYSTTTAEDLLSYVEKAALITDVPENEDIIEENYNLLRKSIIAPTLSKADTKYAITQFIYNNLFLFQKNLALIN